MKAIHFVIGSLEFKSNTVCFIQFSQLFLLTDIDECVRGIHGCHHNCRNVPGSYFCSCKRGFRLSNDLKTCVGRSVGLALTYISIF